jgi:GT2 family glycosyltransferase
VRDKNMLLLRDCLTSLHNWWHSGYDLEVIVIPNNMEGFEKSINKGLKLATGDWVMLLNDDVEFTGMWWNNNMHRALKDPSVGIINLTGYEWEGLPSYWCVMISKAALDKVGLLDEEFKNFSSDHDHAHRIKLAGFKVLHLPRHPAIVHKHCQTTKTLPDENERIEFGKARMKTKWGFR